LAAAAILVLLVMIFLVNLTAILLRNRYERKW
jgi:ABC-type phosphate transport system permease subunit